MDNMTVTKETLVGELVNNHPETAEVLFGIGMHCLGCPASQAESVENACAVHTVLGVSVAQIQQIGDFMVVGKTLAGSGYHHYATGRIRINDFFDFAVLSCICHGGAAEFQNFHKEVLSLYNVVMPVLR